MSKDPKILISHIIESIKIIEEYTKNLEKTDFKKSVKTQDAVLRRLEIVGEAANQLPDQFLEQHPNIPWHKMRGMRNVIVHEYFAIDLELAWNTVTKDLPALKKQLEEI